MPDHKTAASDYARPSMFRSRNCSHCRLDFPTLLPECPHCGLPRLFPNVAEAEDDKKELDRRYERAIRAATTLGTEGIVKRFEHQASRSVAVTNRSVAFVAELADATTIFTTFYKKRDGGMLIPQGSKWDALRGAADEFFFGQNKDEIRFAALSCDGVGLSNYGECTMVLGEQFIAHRTSLFETNTARFLERGGIFRRGKSPRIPGGSRASWADRGKLAIAKLGASITATTIDTEFPRILLTPRLKSDDDEFIEAHIFGPLTIRSFSKVTLPKTSQRLSTSGLKGLTQKLTKLSIAVPSPP